MRTKARKLQLSQWAPVFLCVPRVRSSLHSPKIKPSPPGGDWVSALTVRRKRLNDQLTGWGLKGREVYQSGSNSLTLGINLYKLNAGDNEGLGAAYTNTGIRC